MGAPTTPKIQDHLEAFLGEWIISAKATSEWAKAPNGLPPPDIVTLQGMQGDGNFVTREGFRHLVRAAETMLRQLKLGRRVKLETVLQSMEEAFGAQRERARHTRSFSIPAIIAAANKALKETKTTDGIYVYPVVFAPSAFETDIAIGSIRLLSKPKFESFFASAFEDARVKASSDTWLADGLKVWDGHQAHYDHFILVMIAKHEFELGRKTGREAAEYLLNLIRMFVGYHHTDDIRIGGGYRWEVEQSFLMFGTDGTLHPSWSQGPYGTILRDEWQRPFLEQLAPELPMLGNFAAWLVSGNDPNDPVLERLRYANQLIAEAYSEPFDRMRLVRLISALEALALLSDKQKAEELATRCAEAACFGEAGRFNEIYGAILHSYRLRNAVVHGDAPEEVDAQSAFLAVEKYLLEIVIGFMALLGYIRQECKPQSAQALRREANKSRHAFFPQVNS